MFARIALFFLALPTLPAHALPESRFSQVIGLLNRGEYETGSFNGTANAEIRFVKWSQQGTGCLVISPGRTEAGIKYIEVAQDFLNRGYATVYAIDHRGQGFSDRLLPEREKGHVGSFSDYVKDFKTFVDTVVLQDSSCRQREMDLLAHSMGGAIATLYLEQEGRSSPFRKAAFSAPMHKINFAPDNTEESALWKARGACLTPFGPECNAYVPDGGPYNPARSFDNPKDNSLTHSRARFSLQTAINQKWPEARVGSSTVRWVWEAIYASRQLRKAGNASRVATPILILQAGNDTSVDNSGQDEFCRSAPDCQTQLNPGAMHEILMESDSMRSPALERIFGFFSR